MAATYTYSYPVAQPGTVPSSGAAPAMVTAPQQPVAMDPNAYAQYATQCAQYAQYQQYAAQYQQYAAQVAAAGAPQPAAAAPKNITSLTPSSYYSQHYKQYQPHTVQISGMDKSKAPNIKEISDKFGTVGTIKLNHHGQCSIRCRPDDGIVTVEYESAASVESAIKWFNDSEFDGSTIVVQLAPESSPDVSKVQSTPPPAPPHGPGIRPPHFGMPGHPMHGPYGPHPPHHNPHAGPRPGDWDCPKCQNSNFQFRTECRRCKEPRGERTAEEKAKEEKEKEEARKNGTMLRGRGGRGRGFEMRPRFGHPEMGPWGPRPPPFMHRGGPRMGPPFMGARPPFGPPRHLMRGTMRGVGMKRGGGLGRGTKTNAKTKPY